MTIIEYLNSHEELPPMCKLQAMYIETENGISTLKGDICWVIVEPRKDENGNIYRAYPERKFRDFSNLYKDKDNVFFQVIFEPFGEINHILFYDGNTLEYIGEINQIQLNRLITLNNG